MNTTRRVGSTDYQKLIAKIAKIAGRAVTRHPILCAQLIYALLLAVLFMLLSVPATAQDAREVARKVLPSVVMIEVTDASGRTISLGSGFFVRSGVIVTNHHVIRGGTAARAHVAATDTNYTVAGIIAQDVDADLVLLKLTQANMPSLPLADLSRLEIGESVYVFGSPKGLEGSVTNGILSSTSLRRHNGGEFLQITAPISHGTSGGAVTNAAGEVIGVATMWVVGGQNINFAVPSTRITTLLANAGQPMPLGAVLGVSESKKPSAKAEEASACGDTPLLLPGGHTADFYVRAGEELYDRQQYAEAKEAYKRAVDIEPQKAWSHFALAHIYLKLGCDKRAILANKQAIILEPSNTTYRDGLGWMLINLGRYGEAAGVYEDALRVSPKHALMRTRLGIAYASLGRIEDGMRAFREALRTDEQCALAHYWLGKMLAVRFKDREAALTHYRVLETLDASLADDLLTVLEKR
jgi:Tfp pilus assembly protein PilF